MQKIRVEISKWELAKKCGDCNWEPVLNCVKAGENENPGKDDLNLLWQFFAEKYVARE